MVIKQAVPIFEQVDRMLRDKIFSGDFPVGVRLPSESALATEFGVSRATIRMVLGKMETEGIVSRKHGDGTYINKHVLGVDVRPTRKMSFKNLIEETGRKADVILISVLMRLPSKDEAERLEIQKKEEVLELICCFLADKQPAIYSHNVYLSKIFTTPPSEFNVLLGMDDFIKKYTTEQITYSVSNITASAAPEEIAKYLKIKPGEPILKSYDMFYSLQNKAVVFGTNYYHNEAYRLRIAQPW